MMMSLTDHIITLEMVLLVKLEVAEKMSFRGRISKTGQLASGRQQPSKVKDPLPLQETGNPILRDLAIS